MGARRRKRPKERAISRRSAAERLQETSTDSATWRWLCGCRDGAKAELEWVQDRMRGRKRSREEDNSFRNKYWASRGKGEQLTGTQGQECMVAAAAFSFR